MAAYTPQSVTERIVSLTQELTEANVASTSAELIEIYSVSDELTQNAMSDCMDILAARASELSRARWNEGDTSVDLRRPVIELLKVVAPAYWRSHPEE